MNDILTIKELCEKLKLSRETIYQLRKQGMPCIKINRSIRFDEKKVMEWLNEH